MNERALTPFLQMIEIYWHTSLTIKHDVYEAFVNPEECFWEGLCHTVITQNLLL